MCLSEAIFKQKNSDGLLPWPCEVSDAIRVSILASERKCYFLCRLSTIRTHVYESTCRLESMHMADDLSRINTATNSVLMRLFFMSDGLETNHSEIYRYRVSHVFIVYSEFFLSSMSLTASTKRWMTTQAKGDHPSVTKVILRKSNIMREWCVYR